jgi:hypothetical protein
MLNLGAEVEHMPVRLLAKDIILDAACIGVPGQFLPDVMLGVLAVENPRRDVSTDKEKQEYYESIRSTAQARSAVAGPTLHRAWLSDLSRWRL